MRFAANFTAKGSQTSKSFLWWFVNIFVPETAELRSGGRHVLVLDNHKSHLMSLDAMREAVRNRIIIVFLLTNTTQDCMVLDLSVFGPFKQSLRRLRRSQYDDSRPLADQVVPIVSAAVRATWLPSTFMSGFHEAGMASKDASGADVLAPTVELLVKKLAGIAAKREAILEDQEEGEVVPLSLEQQQLLEDRLASLKSDRLRELYKKVFERGKLRIPKLKTSSAAVFDSPYIDQLQELENFALQDEGRKKAQKAAEKEQLVLERQERASEKERAKATEKTQLQKQKDKVEKLEKETKEHKAHIKDLEKELSALKKKVAGDEKKRVQAEKRKVSRSDEAAARAPRKRKIS